MLSIRDFFEKVQNSRSREVFVRSVVCDAIKKHTSVVIPMEAVAFSARALVLKNLNSVAKSEIFIKKKAIIEEINKNQTIRVVDDIR